MEYSIYKLDFTTGVHFGTGILNESSYTFCADQLFSALYLEALKMNMEKEFYEASKEGNLLFSDAFPYMRQQYMVPKPIVYIEPLKKGNSNQKKAYKKIKYLPIDQLSDFLEGKLDILNDPMKDFGYFGQHAMAKIRLEEEARPFRVGTFFFAEDCGLYILLAYQGKKNKELAEQLLESLSYTGIGGKKTSGLGKFTLRHAKIPENYMDYIKKQTERKMLLSVAFPKDCELDMALEKASYQLLKRSGFIYSLNYADEWRRKKDIYVFSAGSCFFSSFRGDIYDVSDGGRHSVYRYAKPLFMGV